MHTCIERKHLSRKKGRLSLCILLQLEKNTPEVPELNVFQIVLQLDLVLDGSFVPRTCNLYTIYTCFIELGIKGCFSHLVSLSVIVLYHFKDILL